MTSRQRLVEHMLAGGFLGATALAAVTLPWERTGDAPALVGLVALYALASRVEFEIGSGRAVPEQLVFVPILFLAPLPLVPLLVAAGFLLARLPDLISGEEHPERWINSLTDAWFSLGPVFVLGLLAPGNPELAHLDVYLLALAAQMAVGLAAAATAERWGYGVDTSDTLRAAGWSYGIDAAMSPVGLVFAFAANETLASLLALVPIIWVFHVFARERERRIAAVLDLGDIYQGTVMLISDFVEFEDHYTADHCRSVVELVDAVADEMRMEREDIGIVAGGRLEMRFAALLHDVGKMATPKPILNKPAALTTAEFEVIKLHTLEGQRILDRVGGPLRRVGQIVRSCHERWDGEGYPDGLRGEEIPLQARIVFCCDAFSAMTSDRAYRRRMDPELALEEIHANAGTQFDPRVAAVLETVIRRALASPEREQGHEPLAGGAAQASAESAT